MTLMAIDYKEKTQDGNKYESTTFALGKYYMVRRFVTRFEDGSVYKRFCVEASYEDRHDNYIPEIYYDDGLFGDEKPRFEIQTVSYGAMSSKEIEKVIAGYTEAVEAVRILTMNFC